ncbi:MAG: N-acetyltransferase [Myxococcales bacterium]|nr:N-acetyltransferase [Myxococcales bacterium]
MVEEAAGPTVHPTALVESSSVGCGTRIWAFAHVLAGAVIGRDCNVGDHCFVEGGARIGNGVVLKNGVSVWDKVRLDDCVFVGPNVVFTNDPYPRADPRWKAPPECWKGTRVHAHATIGANATIVCGLEIGSYAMIAAGATVTRSVRPYELVSGTPARHAGWVCECGAVKSDGQCPRCVGSELSCGQQQLEKGPRATSEFVRENGPPRRPQ